MMIPTKMRFIATTLLVMVLASWVTSLSAAFSTIASFSSSLPLVASPFRTRSTTARTTSLYSSLFNDEDPESLKKRAEQLREQIRKMEEEMNRLEGEGEEGQQRRSSNRNSEYIQPFNKNKQQGQQDMKMSSLHRKQVLVTGANGRLGSMVCRYLLRNHPTTQVVACVHVVSENSPTSRGYARLSYEVGAEDGIGKLGAAWSEDRTATFQWDDETMRDYNLQNLRVVECELLDPVQCQSVAEGCDAVIWCATDYNGNQPRAVSGLNVAFLFRAVTRPDKGRVEIEGLQNMLGALKLAKQDKARRNNPNSSASTSSTNDPTNFVLVSTAPDAFEDFETPFGSFIGVKRQGEQMTLQDFPSLKSTVVQLSRFDDNFVGEGLDIQMEIDETTATTTTDPSGDGRNKKARRKINRRDAAKAVVDALVNEDIVGKTVQVWTAS